jgi:uncharacterized protein YukE
MAGNVYGADVAELRSLGDKLARSADDLDRIANLLTHQITSTTAWVGPNAQKFRGEWSGAHRGAVATSARALRDCAATLRRNADEQDRTSAADSSSAGTYGSSPGPGSTGYGGVPDVEHALSVLDALRAVKLPNGMNAWDTALALGSVTDNPITGAISDVQTFGGAIESLANGKLDIFQASDVVSTTLKLAPPFSVAHLSGTVLSIWTLVGREAMNTDFSATGMGEVVSEIGRDPLGSAEVVVTSVEVAIPDILSAIF